MPLCGFLTFQCDLPLRASAVHVAYSREPQSMRLYDRSSAIHAAYTAGIPQSMRAFGRGLRSPCGYYFPIQNLENISLTRSSPSDSPRIRPRLRMHLSGLWNKNPPAFRFLCYFLPEKDFPVLLKAPVCGVIGDVDFIIEVNLPTEEHFPDFFFQVCDPGFFFCGDWDHRLVYSAL